MQSQDAIDLPAVRSDAGQRFIPYRIEMIALSS
jgi:hypothetical protein